MKILRKSILPLWIYLFIICLFSTSYGVSQSNQCQELFSAGKSSQEDINFSLTPKQRKMLYEGNPNLTEKALQFASKVRKENFDPHHTHSQELADSIEPLLKFAKQILSERQQS